jgi:hypothetical protein
VVKRFILYRFEQQNVQLQELMADKERTQSQAAKDAIQQQINQTKVKMSNLGYKLATAEAKSRNAGGSPNEELVPLDEIGKLRSYFLKISIPSFMCVAFN